MLAGRPLRRAGCLLGSDPEPWDQLAWVGQARTQTPAARRRAPLGRGAGIDGQDRGHTGSSRQ